MKALLFLLFPLGAMGQAIKPDTVKCWVATADPKDSTHLLLIKGWAVRVGRWEPYKNYWIAVYRPVKYLQPNRRDSIAVVGDFKPIIQEWK